MRRRRRMVVSADGAGVVSHAGARLLADLAEQTGLSGQLSVVRRAAATACPPLFAALEVATGKATGIVQPRHRHQEFLRFLKQIARAYPDDGTGREPDLVTDNYAAHRRVEIRDWLEANPRIHVHFTPTSASWLNMVEIWFGIIERQAIPRGTFRSVKELNAKIRAFINGWNDRAHPFICTKTVDDILTKAKRPTIINSGHQYD